MFGTRLRWLSALPLLLVTGALCVLALLTLGGANANSGGARDRLFDFFQRLHAGAPGGLDAFHVVLIDDKSIDRVGPWPWPRTVLADLAGKAADAGARGVIVVETVDGPDPLSPETIGAFWLGGARDEALARQLALLPSTDAVLGAALGRAASAAAVGVAPETAPGAALQGESADARAADWLSLSDEASGDRLALPALRLRAPIAPSLSNKTRLAAAPLRLDGDGALREATLLWAVDGAPMPSVALEAARLAVGAARVDVTADATAVTAAGRIPRRLDIGGKTIALSSSAGFRFHFPRQIRAPETPAWRVLDSAASNGQLRGKVVLIGRDADQGERIQTERGYVSLASAHALAAGQLVSGAQLIRPAWAGALEATALMLFGAAAIMWSQRLQFWNSLGVAGLCAAALIGLSYLAFSVNGLLIDPLPAALGLGLGAMSVAGGRSIGEVLRDDVVRGSFQSGLPEPAMKKLRENDAAEILSGDLRPITVLACELRLLDEDLRQLTNSPEDVTRIISSAMIELRAAIMASGGTADQVEGGRIFGFFNAPLRNENHVEGACAAALRLIESMDKVNADIESSSRLRGVQLNLAIGAASGECFVGPTGPIRANRYSAIGAAVDMAAFLRSQAETYGPAIICDETIYRKSHHHFAFLELDRLRMKKLDKPMTIYALVGNPFIKSSKGYRALEEHHRAFLHAYRAGDFTAAREHLAKAKDLPNSRIALFDLYEQRLNALAEKGPPPDWDGAEIAAL